MKRLPADERRARDLRIIAMIAEGWTDERMGRELHMASESVRNLQVRIRDEYGAVNRAHLVALAMRAGDLT